MAETIAASLRPSRDRQRRAAGLVPGAAEITMEIGSRVGPYEIRQPLGQGGMAQVWKAWHVGLHRFEALKIPTPHLIVASAGASGDQEPGDERTFVARFLHEARIAAGLRHPHIATIYGVSEEDAPQPFFAMELVEGRDLAALLQARGSLSISEALPILEAIASALDYAHGREVIHRDIKPANVLLEAGRHGWIPKVVDFGIAHAGRGASDAGPGPHLWLSPDEDTVGTPEYMSPEQAGSGEHVGPRSDIYSLGVVAYEMLCGRPPFVAQDGFGPASILEQHLSDPPPLPSTWNSELPPALDDLLSWALAKSPSQRPASATGWVQVLRDAAQLQAPQGTASTWRYDDAVEAGLLTTPANAADSASTYTAPASPTLLQARAPGRAHLKAPRRWLVPAILAASLCLGAALGMVKSRLSRPAPPASTWEPEAASEPPAVQSALALAPTTMPTADDTEAPTADATAFPDKAGAQEDAGADDKRRQARAESTAQRARRVKIEVIDNLLLLRKRQERDLLRPEEAQASRRRLLAQLREALSLCEAALKLDADNETAWEQKAASLFLMGRFEEALDVAERGLQKFPGNRDLRDARDKASGRLSRAPQKKA